MKVFNIFKKVGETPLEALERFRASHNISKVVKLTYAGRLDPMARGVLLILQGATQSQREKYLSLKKEYMLKILFGFETDSFDLLGMPKSMKHEVLSMKEILIQLKNYHGLVKLPIPAYSSVLYKGKPLFEWARKGKIKLIHLPKREMEVKKIKVNGFSYLSSKVLLSYIENNIKKVKGDFRQIKILKGWKELLSKGALKYLILNILISVASGTYIRSIAHDLGKKLKTGAVVFSLERTKVGKYKAKLG